MAETIKCVVTADGTAIPGYTSITESGGVDRTGSIEALSFQHEIVTARERGSSLATGRREYKPLYITKRLDEATPLLAKALRTNQVIGCVLDFFRANPESGVTEHYFTIEISGGRIASIEMISPDASNVSDSTAFAYERVSFVFHTIIWRHVSKGTEDQDQWNVS